jgi:chromosome partitioning protein
MQLNVPGHRHLRKIVVLNPKGGCGKTTLAINVAGYLASKGKAVALMDTDPN